jgi:hypothetical protein
MTPETMFIKAATIAFVSATHKITDSGTGMAFIKSGDLIKISGAATAGNNGYFLVATGNVAAEIVVTEALTDEAAAAGTVTIEVVRQAITFRGGDNSLAEKGSYGHVKEFTIEGKGGEDTDSISMAASWEVRQWIVDAFTASLAIPAVDVFSFAESQLFIDAAGGTIGTTDAGVMTDFNYKYVTGIRKRYGSNNSKNFDSALLRGGPEIVFKVGLPWDTVAQAEVAAWRNQTARLIRCQCNGVALGTTGAYLKKLVRMDMPGKWENFDGLDDVQGGDIVRGTFRCKYNSTAALNPDILVVNELSTLVA